MKRILALSLVLIAATVIIGYHFRIRSSPQIPSVTAPPDPVVPEEIVEAPAPPPPAAEKLPAPLPPADIKPPEKTVFQRIASNDTNVFTVSPEQVHAFLARNQTNADSLLAVCNATHDRELLKEAARR